MSDTLDALPPEVAKLLAPHMAGRDDDVSISTPSASRSRRKEMTLKQGV